MANPTGVEGADVPTDSRLDADSVHLDVVSISGEQMAAIPDAKWEWWARDVVTFLPKAPADHHYKLAIGGEMLAGLKKLRSLAPQPLPVSLQIVAVLVLNEETQREMDLALIKAAQALDFELIESLLGEGASAKFLHDPEGHWGSKDSKTALHAAIIARGRDTEPPAWRPVVERLLAAKADVNAKRSESDWRGCGSERTAFEMILPTAMADAALLKMFLDAGADANTKTVRNVHSMRTDGRSVKFVLHQAVKTRNIDVARALLQAGAHVDAIASEHFVNERGYNTHMDETSLHIACKDGNLAMSALLLEYGADVNCIRKDLEQEHVELSDPYATDDPREEGFESHVRCIPVQETALHLAIASKNKDLVAFLVCAGAEASLERKRGDDFSSTEGMCEGNVELLRALKSSWRDARTLFDEAVVASMEAAVACRGVALIGTLTANSHRPLSCPPVLVQAVCRHRNSQDVPAMHLPQTLD
eukprot:CAMPEP_0115224296 /NCGR_PEP_ID=MMETSP0270-20121206/29500_1 /TAXON_ID=71861 /ORGANISM="Scrippsiella trochoidea, Strain CCMP3099" /LENGTH=475 /DNA_ID=CAMNT_0002638599 /DNA_START=86 /DNA_END=1509 /DNA_ORIENTATION=+